MEHVRYRYRDEWPLTGAVGFVDRSQHVSFPPFVRGVFENGDLVPEEFLWTRQVSFSDRRHVRGGGGAAMPAGCAAADFEGVVNTICREYGHVSGVVPPTTWKTSPVNQASRVVLIAQLHDPVFAWATGLPDGKNPNSDPDNEGPAGEVGRTSAESPAQNDLLSVIWHDVIRATNNAAGARDLWILLFVDPPADAGLGSKQALAALEANLRKGVKELNGDRPPGFNIVLVSHRSQRFTANATKSDVSLWNSKAPWDEDYKSNAVAFAHSLLSVLMSYEGLPEDHFADEKCFTWDQTSEWFSTPSLFHFDDMAIAVQRYAVMRKLKEDIMALLRRLPKEANSDNPLHDTADWVRRRLERETAATADSSRSAAAPRTAGSVHEVDLVMERHAVAVDGELDDAIAELRQLMRDVHTATCRQIERLRNLFSGPEGEYKAKFDRNFETNRKSIRDSLESDMATSLSEDGVEETMGRLDRLARYLANEQTCPSRVPSTFPWPPKPPEGVEQELKDLEMRNNRLKQCAQLENQTAILFHSSVAAVIFGIGTGLLTDALIALFFQWIVPGMVWLRWVILPCVSFLGGAACFGLLWLAVINARKRRFEKIKKALRSEVDTIRNRLQACEADLRLRFEETFRKLYNLRLIRFMRREVERVSNLVASRESWLRTRQEACEGAEQFLLNISIPSQSWHATPYGGTGDLQVRMNTAYEELKKRVQEWDEIKREDLAKHTYDVVKAVARREARLIVASKQPAGAGCDLKTWWDRLAEAARRYLDNDGVANRPALRLKMAPRDLLSDQGGKPLADDVAIQSVYCPPGSNTTSFVVCGSKELKTAPGGDPDQALVAFLNILDVGKNRVIARLPSEGSVVAGKLWFCVSSDRIQWS